MNELKVTIVTPEGVIFDGEVLNITLPGAEGEFGVYPNHCSLVSLLKSGVIELVNHNHQKEYVAIDWGYAKVEQSKIDILANGAVAITQDNKMMENIQKAKKLIEEASSDNLLISGALSKLEHLARR